eukprot:4664964-Amphidinium_carterae.1
MGSERQPEIVQGLGQHAYLAALAIMRLHEKSVDFRHATVGNTPPQSRVLLMFCKSGRHRSVAMAEFWHGF